MHLIEITKRYDHHWRMWRQIHRAVPSGNQGALESLFRQKAKVYIGIG